MGPIDDLNFEVILKDEEFGKKIDADIAKANELNTSLSRLLEFSKSLPAAKTIISKTGVKNAEDMAKALAEMKEHLDGMPDKVKVVTSGEKEHRDAVEQTNTALSGTESMMRTIAQLTGVAFGIATIRRFASELVQTTGAFEVQKMALSSMLQDMNKANEIFATLRQNALESPYTFQDLTKFAKQLVAFNIPTDEIVETEKRLADVAAGLGVDMGRIILAYGQVKAAGALKGQELRQFTESGVPILEQLARQIEEVENRTVSLSEVFQRVSKKQISFEMVEEAFRRMTSEGGKFYNMQEVLVETLQGKIGKLRDVWQQALYDMGTANEGFLKGSVDFITKVVANLDELGKRIPEIVTAWGAFKAVQIAVEVGSNKLVLTNHKLLASLKGIGQWIAKNPYAILAAAVAAVTIEAVRFGKEIYQSANKAKIAQQEFAEAIKTATTNITNEREALRRLQMTANNELLSMKERTEAIDVINAQYSEYLRNLGIEKVSIDNLGTSYNALRDAIANKYLAELKEQTVGKQQAASAQARAELNAFNAEFIRNTKISVGKNAGKNYGAGGIGLIQGAIERFIDEHPMYDKQALTNSIANIYKKYGLEIAAGSKTAGDLYRVVEDYVDAGSLLKNAERDFDNFAKGYGKSLGMFDSTSTTAVNDEGKKTWGDANKKASEAKERISDIQREVQILERYLKQRKEAEEYLGDGASSWMASVDGKKSADYFSTLEKQIADYVSELRTLGDAGNDAADAIEGRLGTDAMTIAIKGLRESSKAANDADKAMLKYLDTLEKWAIATQEISGTGAVGNVSKAIADYKKAIAGNDSKFFDMAGGGSNVSGGFQTSVMLWAKNRANALVLLKQNLSKSVDDIFKEQMQKQGFDLTNLNDKSLSQLLDIKKAIETMKVPDDIKAMLKALGPEGQSILDALEEAFNDFKEKYGENTIDPELLEKIAKVSVFAAKKVKELASSFGRLGEAIDDANLSEAANSISTIGDFASDVAQGFSQAGAAGAVIGALASMAKIIINDVAEGAEQTAEATERAKKAALAYSQAIEKAAINSHSTIFGTNDVGKFNEYVRIVGKYRTILKEISDIVDTEAPGLLEALGYTDANGNIDIEKVKADLEAGTLTGEGLLDMINNLQEAQKEIDSVMESLFGDIASSAADKIIDSWIEAGEAALDYADILDDVAKSYAKMLIQSMIMENFLDPITKDLKSAFMENRYEDAMEMISGAMDNIANSAPMFEQILSAFDPYFNYGGSDSSNSVGSGIKSITEDTASLLASYINAIRADVSVIRGLQEKGFASVDVIGQAIPTLNDYLNQVAANTFDTAQNTQRILGELQSVIGAEGSSGSIVRVQVA